MSLKSDNQLAAEYCMRAANQTIREQPSRPSEAERLLRATLILEEALETINALGVAAIDFSGARIFRVNEGVCLVPGPPESFDLVETIDGCCDLNVVVAGTMSCIGARDKPHMDEVHRANAAKFPHGVAVPHPTVPGKYGKPDGWLPPNHVAVLQQVYSGSLEEETVL